MGRTLKPGPKDSILQAQAKPPLKLVDSEASDGLYVAHTPSKAWFRCFIFGTAPDAQMMCMPLQPKKSKHCGWRRCDYHRQTFRTECLQPASGLMSILGAQPQCIYVGHAGQPQPTDIQGKPTDYAVYMMSCPSGDAVAAAAAATASAAAATAVVRSLPYCQTWQRGADFLLGPCMSTRSTK